MSDGYASNKQRLTMEERIQAFYQQSGGPNTPRIREFLNQHLLYGKDHGVPGYKENLEDAFIDMVVTDPSMLILFQRFQRWRNRVRSDKPETSATSDSTGDQVHLRLQQQVQSLQQEVTRLREALDTMATSGHGVVHYTRDD